jgi:hypothetical protein
MQRKVALHKLASAIGDATVADGVRTALRRHLFGVPLKERDREAVERGVAILGRALNAVDSDAETTPDSSSFAQDSRLLDLIRSSQPDPIFVDEATLRRLQGVLVAVSEGRDPARPDVDEAIALVVRVNASALKTVRSLQDGRARFRTFGAPA